MRARSALFDLYGDHLRSRGNAAPVSAVVRLLGPVGIQAPAVRTAISRLVAQGWLVPEALPGGRGYRATPQAVRRIDAAAERIYRLRREDWDGRWHLALLDRIESRPVRTRVREQLAWLGFAELSGGTWVSPWERSELAGALERSGASASTAVVTDFDPPERPLQAWDLEGLGARYAAWSAGVDAAVASYADGRGHPERDPDEAAFATRFHLVHEWRKFLFRDPGLPDELLPEDWPGREAAARFTELARQLGPGTDRFVERCLSNGA